MMMIIIIIKCSWINKKYKTNHFLKMFPDRGQSFNGLKLLTEIVIAVASLTGVGLWLTTQRPA